MLAGYSRRPVDDAVAAAAAALADTLGERGEQVTERGRRAECRFVVRAIFSSSQPTLRSLARSPKQQARLHSDDFLSQRFFTRYVVRHASGA